MYELNLEMILDYATHQPERSCNIILLYVGINVSVPY